MKRILRFRKSGEGHIATLTGFLKRISGLNWTEERRPSHGFTLIELLIVVAIISILAVLAVPRFQDALIKAKVSTARANVNAMGKAFVRYRLDKGHLPPGLPRGRGEGDFMDVWENDLTTPVPYLTEQAYDPFHSGPANMYEKGALDNNQLDKYGLMHKWHCGSHDPNKVVEAGHFVSNEEAFAVESLGPDALVDSMEMGLSSPLASQIHLWVEGYAGSSGGYKAKKPGGGYLTWRDAFLIGGSVSSDPKNNKRGAVGPYDPSNGIKSPGDIPFVYP